MRMLTDVLDERNQQIAMLEQQIATLTAERDEARAKIEKAQHYCDYYKANSAIALELREALK